MFKIHRIILIILHKTLKTKPPTRIVNCYDPRNYFNCLVLNYLENAVKTDIIPSQYCLMNFQAILKCERRGDLMK